MQLNEDSFLNTRNPEQYGRRMEWARLSRASWPTQKINWRTQWATLAKFQLKNITRAYIQSNLRKRRNIVVATEIRLWAGRSDVGIPIRPSDFSLLRDVPTGWGTHPASYAMSTGVISWEYSGRSMMFTTHPI